MNLMNVCMRHLVAIGAALQAYEKDHGDFPEWLSELHPNYLTDACTLVCPADEEKGTPIQARGTTLWQLVAEAVKDDSTD